MKVFLISMLFIFTACEGGLTQNNDDKRTQKKSVQSLSFDWSGLSDKYESGVKFKDVD